MTDCREEFEKWWNVRDFFSEERAAAYHAWQTAWKASAPEEVTVEDIAMLIQDWKFNEENQQPFFGDYLAEKFPNGLKVTKGKQDD